MELLHSVNCSLQGLLSLSVSEDKRGVCVCVSHGVVRGGMLRRSEADHCCRHGSVFNVAAEPGREEGFPVL